MQVIDKSATFAETLVAERMKGRTVGLVPTMGALHGGHRSLIERAAAECDVVAVTVFVNPLQFDDAADLESYPKTFEADALVASTAGAAVMFVPGVSEMYRQYPLPPASSVRVRGISEILEGAFRPGHFDGVATVVTKLFNLAGPCAAYFGEKDFQQLAVVRQLVEDLSMQVRIVACPTARESDGLAMSSRNGRLSVSQRKAAPVLRAALSVAANLVAAGERSPEAVRNAMAQVVSGEPMVVLDYAEVVDPVTLETPAVLRGEVRLLIAGTFGDVRLIDNDGAYVGRLSRPSDKPPEA